MPVLSDDQKDGIGTALNEAILIGVHLEPAESAVAATFEVYTLPEIGPMPEDRRVLLRFTEVTRVAASLRLGNWDDPAAPVQTLDVMQLAGAVTSFGGAAVYGWKFIDQDADIAKWENRLSLDWHGRPGPAAHSIALFQEGDDRHLDLAIWFGALHVSGPDGREIALREFIAGGRRWWTALRANDPRTQGLGIVPLR